MCSACGVLAWARSLGRRSSARGCLACNLAGGRRNSAARTGVRILSVSTDYPGPRNPRRGLFVQRRLAALARLEQLQVVHLEPWFPWVRPLHSVRQVNGAAQWPAALHHPMFYLPGVLKGLDSHWVKKAVLKAVRTTDPGLFPDLLDAHFGYPEGVGCVK